MKKINNNLMILSSSHCPDCGELWDEIYLRNGIHWKYFCKANPYRKKTKIEYQLKKNKKPFKVKKLNKHFSVAEQVLWNRTKEEKL